MQPTNEDVQTILRFIPKNLKAQKKTFYVCAVSEGIETDPRPGRTAVKAYKRWWILEYPYDDLCELGYTDDNEEREISDPDEIKLQTTNPGRNFDVVTDPPKGLKLQAAYITSIVPGVVFPDGALKNLKFFGKITVTKTPNGHIIGFPAKIARKFQNPNGTIRALLAWETSGALVLTPYEEKEIHNGQ